MALVALLFAHHAAAGAAEPRAAMTVAGLPVLERQVMLVKAVGAARIFVMAERMPPGLAAALSRVRDLVEVVRDPASLAASIADGDRVLTLEEGLITGETLVRTLVDIGAPVLAVSHGDPPYDGAERLDSNSFWTGLAVYDGRLVRTVVTDLGEWDLQSTLLRSAVGEGAQRLDMLGAGGPDALLAVADMTRIAATDERLINEGEPPRRGWPSRYLYRPLERFALRSVLPTRVDGRSLVIASAAAGAAAALAFASGWPAAGLLIAVVAPLLATTGAWLGKVRLEVPATWIDPAFDHAIEPAWYLGLAAWLARTESGLGAWALAGALIGFRQAMLRQQHFMRTISIEEDGQLRRWLAGRDTLIWALVPFALFGAWAAGLAALAIYAAASFFLLQSRLFASIAATVGKRL